MVCSNRYRKKKKKKKSSAKFSRDNLNQGGVCGDSSEVRPKRTKIDPKNTGFRRVKT